MQIYYVDETGISTIQPAKVVAELGYRNASLQRGGRLIQCYHVSQLLVIIL